MEHECVEIRISPPCIGAVLVPRLQNDSQFHTANHAMLGSAPLSCMSKQARERRAAAGSLERGAGGRKREQARMHRLTHPRGSRQGQQDERGAQRTLTDSRHCAPRCAVPPRPRLSLHAPLCATGPVRSSRSTCECTHSSNHTHHRCIHRSDYAATSTVLRCLLRSLPMLTPSLSRGEGRQRSASWCGGLRECVFLSLLSARACTSQLLPSSLRCAS